MANSKPAGGAGGFGGGGGGGGYGGGQGGCEFQAFTSPSREDRVETDEEKISRTDLVLSLPSSLFQTEEDTEDSSREATREEDREDTEEEVRRVSSLLSPPLPLLQASEMRAK